GIWMQVLGLDRVGINDNFFELGGHSLFATQVMSRVRETFQTDIPLKVLFERPTVEELVESIREARTAGTGQKPQAIARASREGELPLSFAQQRLWFIEQFEPNSPSYNLPLGLRLRGELNVEALRLGLRGIERRHESLRTRFESRDGRAVQVIEPAAAIELAHVDLSNRPVAEAEQELRDLVEREVRRGFNLSTGPLFRAVLYSLGERAAEPGEEHRAEP